MTIVASLSGCFPFGGSCDKIVDGYAAVTTDSDSDRIIIKSWEDDECVGEGITSEGIVAIGHDENYIIAKQRSVRSVNYYIIDMNIEILNRGPQVQTIGPFNEAQFDSATRSLNIQDVEFDMLYKGALD